MAGKSGVELLVSPTEDNGKILAALASVKLGGKSDLLISLQIASLALLHRKNTNAAKRIIAFVGSPIGSDLAALQKLSQQLKMNNVAIDIVSIGETDANQELLTEIVNSVNTNNNSSLVVVNAGSNERPLDEIMRSSSLGRGGDMGGGMVGGDGFGGGGDGDLGFDESNDPELAMAIRISQEENRAAAEVQAAQAAQAQNDAIAGADFSQASARTSEFPTTMTDGGSDTDDEEMQQALAMSMQMEGSALNLPEPPEAAVCEDEDDDDADMAAALALSVQGACMPPQAPESADSGRFVDPDFVREMLGEVSADLDPDDPLIAAALAQVAAQNLENNKEDNNTDDDGKKRKGPDGSK